MFMIMFVKIQTSLCKKVFVIILIINSHFFQINN